TVNEKFATVSEKFTAVSEKFMAVNEKFTTVNEKFTTVNEKFTTVNEKFSLSDRSWIVHFSVAFKLGVILFYPLQTAISFCNRFRSCPIIRMCRFRFPSYLKRRRNHDIHT